MRARLLGCVLTLLCPPAFGETIELANGDKLSGEVVERTDESVVLEHEVLGRVVVPAAELKPAEGPNPGLFGTGFLRGWKREAYLGVNGSQGNTVNMNLRSSLDLSFENEERRWTINGLYVFLTENHVATDDNGRLSSTHSWLYPGSRWFTFFQSTYDYDKFKNWKHRVTATVGPGYELIETEAVKLRTGIGLAGQREFGGEKNTNFQGFWGVEFGWAINSRLRLDAMHQLFPYLAPDTGEFRSLAKVNLKVDLMESPKLNLLMGFQNEYESNAEDGDKKNDVTYFSSIGIEF